MTLPARLRAHEPAAQREVLSAIEQSRGVLAEVGRLLGLPGSSTVRTTAAGRLVALAGLEEQLAAVQQEHGTGRSGRRPRARVRVLVQITGKALDVLAPAVRARYVDEWGPGPAWAMAEIELDETGRVSGRLVREG